jgi:hypothetical protein
MSSWQPPIPAGALYSKPARQLGSAIALLAYCYDLVQRDGWLDLNLKTAALDMDEAYPTMKRWWLALADGPFFAEIQVHGRKGMRLHFNDIWLDWRILKARPVHAFGTETGSEMIPNDERNQVSGQKRDRNGTETGSEMIPIDRMYKEDQHDQESGSSSPIDRARENESPPTTRNDGGGDFVKILAREFDISRTKAREIAATGVDLETCLQSIRNCVEIGDRAGMGRMINRLIDAPPPPGQPYQRATARASPLPAHRNGRAPPPLSSGFQRAAIIETDLDKDF